MEAIMAKKTPGCAGCPRNLLSSLGMHFGGCHSSPTGRSYTGTRVAKKRVKRLCEENQPADASDYRVRKPESWWELSTRNCEANYFSLGPVSKAYRAVDNLVTCGIGSVDGCALSIRSKGWEAKRFQSGLDSCDWKLGLPTCRGRRHKGPLSESRMREICTSVDERGVETERRLSLPRHSSTLQFAVLNFFPRNPWDVRGHG